MKIGSLIEVDSYIDPLLGEEYIKFCQLDRHPIHKTYYAVVKSRLPNGILAVLHGSDEECPIYIEDRCYRLVLVVPKSKPICPYCFKPTKWSEPIWEGDSEPEYHVACSDRLDALAKEILLEEDKLFDLN